MYELQSGNFSAKGSTSTRHSTPDHNASTVIIKRCTGIEFFAVEEVQCLPPGIGREGKLLLHRFSKGKLRRTDMADHCHRSGMLDPQVVTMEEVIGPSPHWCWNTQAHNSSSLFSLVTRRTIPGTFQIAGAESSVVKCSLDIVLLPVFSVQGFAGHIPHSRLLHGIRSSPASREAMRWSAGIVSVWSPGHTFAHRQIPLG